MSHLGDSGLPDQKPVSSSTMTIVIVEGDWASWEDPQDWCPHITPPVGVEAFRGVVPENDLRLAAAAEHGRLHVMAAAVLGRTDAAMPRVVEWWEGLTEAARHSEREFVERELQELADDGQRRRRRLAPADRHALRRAEELLGLLCILEGASSPELAAVITAANQVGRAWAWAHQQLKAEGDDVLFDLGCWVGLSID